MRCLRPLIPVLLLASCGSDPAPPELTPLQAEFQDLPAEVVPLFVLGDVNEDYRLDSLDLELIGRIAASNGRDSTAASCYAAADLTRDGRVDSADAGAFQALLQVLGDSSALPLYAQPYLRCGYHNRFLAAPMEWRRDRPVRLRLLSGRTTDGVELISIGQPLTQEALPSRRGWDLQVPAGLDSLAAWTIRLSRGDTVLSFTLGSFFGLRQSAPDTSAGKEWVESTWTDDDGDGEPDDPTDVPPPTVFGEEIVAATTCPQKGQGCEALVIDFAKRTWIEADADYTKEALAAVGCNVSYAAPAFVGVPRAMEVVHRATGAFMVVQPDPAAVAQALATNRAAWLEVRAAIARHRAAIPAGKELVVQLVSAHGEDGPRFGTWGPSFGTGAGDMTRRDFHKGNYNVTRGNACHAVAFDWSCAAGNTPKAIQYLNNAGQAHSFQPEPPINHGFHAAFDADMGSGLSSETESCHNGTVLVTDFYMGGIIQRHGRNRDYGTLALRGFRLYVLDESPSKYSDRGYNQGAGSRCEDASHERSY